LLRSCKTVDVQVTESLSLRKENQHETHCLVLVLL